MCSSATFLFLVIGVLNNTQESGCIQEYASSQDFRLNELSTVDQVASLLLWISCLLCNQQKASAYQGGDFLD